MDIKKITSDQMFNEVKRLDEGSYRIESKFKLTSDFLPPTEFTRTHTSRARAVATAIEGVDDPKVQQVLVLDANTGSVVWDSTQEDYQ